MKRRFYWGAALGLALAAVLVPIAVTAVGTDSSALRTAVTVTGIKGHEAQFQQFAEMSTATFGHPTRVDGSVGFTKSVEYAAGPARRENLRSR